MSGHLVYFSLLLFVEEMRSVLAKLWNGDVQEL